MKAAGVENPKRPGWKRPVWMKAAGVCLKATGLVPKRPVFCFKAAGVRESGRCKSRSGRCFCMKAAGVCLKAAGVVSKRPVFPSKAAGVSCESGRCSKFESDRCLKFESGRGWKFKSGRGSKFESDRWQFSRRIFILRWKLNGVEIRIWVVWWEISPCRCYLSQIIS